MKGATLKDGGPIVALPNHGHNFSDPVQVSQEQP